MKLRNLSLTLFSFLLIFLSCNNDDDGGYTPPPLRDATEVYAEDLADIEEFLETHFYNYEEFEANPNSTDFKIVFTKINPDNANHDDKTPIMDRPELLYKMVPDPLVEDLDYKLYYLKVREGAGETLYPSDEAFLTYEGSAVEDGYVFDSAVTETKLNLTEVVGTDISGVITGFREGLIEFKGATQEIDNGDGTFVFNDYGIGAIFVPSGLGYFAADIGDNVPGYSPLIFKIDLKNAIRTDFDRDQIPSYLEDIDGDNNVYSDDTDGDFVSNFLDQDDDGDGVLTKEEIERKSYQEDDTMTPFATKEDARSYYDDNLSDDEIFISVVGEDGTYTLNTVVFTDSNGNGTPDYLDETFPGEE